MLFSQRDETGDKRHQLAVRVFPVQPRRLVVLTIGVVVAALCAAELVASDEHGNALREEKRGQKVALLLCA
jgi:hypothetical protein